jgi:hypothetical protein
MAEKRKVEPITPEMETPEQKIENRILVLEAALAKHLKYHFGAVVQ